LDRRPLLVLSLLLAVTAVAGGLATRLRFEFSPQALLAGSDRLVGDLDQLKQTFSIQDSVVLVIIESIGPSDVVSSEILNWQAGVAGEFGEIEGVVDVRSIATMEIPVRTLSLAPQVEIRPIIGDFPADESDAERVRRMIDRTPALTGTLLSEDRKFGLMLVALGRERSAVEELTPIIDRMREILDRTPPPEDFRIGLSGLPYIRYDAVAALRADQRRLLPLSGLLYLLALVLVFRRVVGSLLPLLAVGMSLAWLMGIMVVTGSSFNLISNVLPILLMVIGMSNCVHVLDSYAEELHHTGGDRREAAHRTMRYMSRCCMVTLLTTGIGFVCLFAARSDVLREFAWQAAVGIGCLYFSILGTFGSLMRLFRPSRRSESGAPLGGLTTLLGRWVGTYPKRILAVSGLLVLVSVGIGSRVRVNSSVIETYDDTHPTQAALRTVERRLKGLLPIEVHLTATETEPLLSTATAHSLLEFEQHALRHPEVLYACSHIDVLRDLSGLSDEDWEADDGERALGRGLLYARRIGAPSGLSDFLSEDHRHARILLKVSDAGTLRLREIIDELRSDLRQRFPEQQGISFRITGDAYVNAMAMNSVIRDLFVSLLTASLVIFGLIAGIFRSVRTGLIASIPNLTPLAITLGYMGWRGYDMNVGNVIVFTISLGIAVDDSIHFLFRFREEMKTTGDVTDAVRKTFSGTGRAILVTSLLIVTGLSVLLLSEFVPTRRFAELTSVTMVGALIGDLFLLPACLVLFWKQPQRRAAGESDHTRSSPQLADGSS
jgi:uncharacterized protein